MSQPSQHFDSGLHRTDAELLSFARAVVVSSRNGNLPSILVDALDVRQLKTSGISDKPGHYEERSKCVDAFAEIWGMPLRDSDLRIGPATREDHRHSIPLDPPFNGNFIPWAKDKDFVAPADI